MKSRIAMVVFSHYPADPRVRREAEALSSAGCEVDVICLKKEGEAALDSCNDVTIHRVNIRRKRGCKSRYLWEYSVFLLLSGLKLSWMHLRHKFDLVHVHNMPNVLVFSAILPKLSGAKVILDMHDPMPEIFMTKYEVPQGHIMIRILRFLERWSVKFANAVLTPNEAFRKLFVARGCPSDKIHVIMNSPQEDIFSPKEEVADCTQDEAFNVMYHGTIVEHNGLDVALQAINILHDHIPKLQFHVYGEGSYSPKMEQLVQEMHLQEVVKMHGHVPLEIIVQQISNCDVGVIPNRRTVFTEINFPTRIFEYLSQGKPVAAPQTSGILDYFMDDELFFFEADSAESLGNQLFKIKQDPNYRRSVLQVAMSVYRKHMWQDESSKLINLVDLLLQNSARMNPNPIQLNENAGVENEL